MKAHAPNHSLDDGPERSRIHATHHGRPQDWSSGGHARASRRRSRLWLLAMLGLGALSGAAAYGLYQRDLARIRRIVRSGSRIIATACGRIECAVQGHGLPVLAVHGAEGGYDQGLLVAGNAFGEGYQVIAPSRFGYCAPLCRRTSHPRP